MDIEEYKRIVQSRLKASQLKKSIKRELDEYEDRQLGIYETSKLKYKPIIESSQEVKTTIDEKQNQLLDQLQKNQSALTNINRDVVKELEFASKEPKMIGPNFDANLKNDMFFINEFNLKMPSELFYEGVNVMDDDQRFQEHLKNLYTLRTSLAEINKKTVKTAPQNIKPRQKYYKIIERVIVALESIDTKKGSGVRNYKQVKRNAYKINGDRYGSLMINMPKLLNEMILEVQKGGQIIYQDNADKSLIDLLTKKFNSKQRYSQKAIEIFNNLNMLSNMPKHNTSKKSTLGSGNIYYTDPNELFKKLQLITGSRKSGNTNLRLKNEAYQIIDKLLELHIISKNQYDKYIQQHLV